MHLAHEIDSWLQQIDDCGHIDPTHIDSILKSLEKAFDHAAQCTLSRSQYRPKRPWISIQTLQIITDTNQARIEGNSFLEKTLAEKVRAFIQQDKTQWFSRLLQDSDWAQIRKLRKKCPRARTALRDNISYPTSSKCRASTFADYFESVQWAVRPIVRCQDERKLNDIHVDCNPIAFRELMSGIDQLKDGKQPGSDDVPSAF